MNIEYSKQPFKAINTTDGNIKGFVPDDVATPADLKDIQAAQTEYANGETVSHDDIHWN